MSNRRLASVGCVLAIVMTFVRVVVAQRTTVPATQPAARPNVIFVLIDDMGYGDLSCYDKQATPTPNIDRLAREGVRFTQFYVAAPICSPSRAALLTGQYPGRWRITSFLDNRAQNRARGMDQWLDPAAPSLARALRAAGYATGHFGKWHLGGQRDVGDAPLITEYGFDKTVTSFEGLGDRYLPLLDAHDGKPPERYGLGSAKLGRGKITWLDRSEITPAYTRDALAFARAAREQGKPFYLNLWLDDVHSPFFPPAAVRGDEAKRTLYRAVVRTMDAQLAVLFDAVRTDPLLRDNTLIVLASDNGPEPGAGSAGPFRGHKGTLYEGGLREPLIVWGPGILPKEAAGTTDESSVVAAIDFAPTVLALAHAAAPAGVKFDGAALPDVLLGRSTLGRPAAGRTTPLFWLRPPDRPGPEGEPWPDLAIRAGDWKLCCAYDGSRVELYDLATDPGETKNLADKEPAVVERLRTPLLAWYGTMPGKKLEPGKSVEGGRGD